jgi:hypothetical protein
VNELGWHRATLYESYIIILIYISQALV